LTGKNNQELLANLIALSLAVGDEASAREFSETLLRLRPQARAGLEGLVASALARSDYKTAAQHGAKLVETAHDSYEAWFLLGLACQKLDRLDRAGQAYAEALKIRPTSAEALANMGLVLERRDDPAGAYKAYERALEAAPEHAGVLWSLALIEEQRNNEPGAEQWLTRLVAASPDSADGWFRLGCLRHRREDYGASAEAFRNCTRISDGWLDAWVNLGLSEWRAGNHDGAKTALQTAVNREPGCVAVLTVHDLPLVDAESAVLAREIVMAFDRVVRTCLAKDPDERWQTAHREFHRLLVARANDQFGRTIAAYQDRAERYWLMFIRANGSGGLSMRGAEHRAIYEAASRRDAAETANLLARHLSRTALTLMAQLAPEHEPLTVRTALQLISG